MKRKYLRLLPLAVAAALLLSLPLSAGSSFEAAAVRIDAASVSDGDGIIIVNDASSNAISVAASGRRIAPASVKISGNAIAVVTEDVAVFEVIKKENGYVLLRAEQGYLTSAETGNGLSYAPEPTEYSLWEIEGDALIRSVNAEYASQKNNYLEYYPTADYFSTYGRNGGSSDQLFRMSFYKLIGDRQQTGDRFRLPLFETSDVHGYLADISSDEYQYRLAYISDKVKDARGYGDAYRADAAVLLDGGDIYQGNTLSNLLEGRSVSAAYEIMDYDAVTIGNHEFDWGIENTVDADGTMPDYEVGGEVFENRVPVVVCNIYKDGEKIGFASDYIILEKNAKDKSGREITVKVAVIGFASEYASSIMNSKFTGAGYTVRYDTGAVNRLAKELESGGEADVTVMLTHGEAEEAAKALGSGTAVDLVLGGHTHNNLCGVTSWGLRYIQPAAYGAAYAYCELVFETDGEGKPFFAGISAARTVRTADEPEKLFNNEKNADDLDRDIVLLTDMFISDISDALNETVGYITTDAMRYSYIPGSGERSSTMGNWLASITARAVGADVGFINSGGIRIDMPLRVYDGRRDVTASDIYALFPFENRIYCYEITYEELLTALEYSLTSSGSTLLSRMDGVQCWYTGSGINAILIDGVAVYSDGKWADGQADKKIKVAVNEYIATSDRSEGGMSNPFRFWIDTYRLISSDTIDREGALTVLREEAEASGGALYIDTEAYYRSGVYAGTSVSYDDWSAASGVLTLHENFVFPTDGAAPWSAFSHEIKKIFINCIPKAIPAGMFDGCVNAEEVTTAATKEQWYATRIDDELLSGSNIKIVCSDGSFKASSYKCFSGEGHLMKSIIVKKPTPDAVGVVQYYCDRCGYTAYEDLPYTGEDTEENDGKGNGSVLVWVIPAASAAVAVPVTAGAVHYSNKKKHG